METEWNSLYYFIEKLMNIRRLFTEDSTLRKNVFFFFVEEKSLHWLLAFGDMHRDYPSVGDMQYKLSAVVLPPSTLLSIEVLCFKFADKSRVINTWKAAPHTCHPPERWICKCESRTRGGKQNQQRLFFWVMFPLLLVWAVLSILS